MGNKQPVTLEDLDLRDRRLLEKIELMLDKKLDEKFTEKFATLDPLFAAIQESFVAMDEKFTGKFAEVDGKFAAMDTKISTLQLSMIDVQEKVTVLTEDMVNVKETLGHHTITLDAISHRMDKWDKEFPIMSHDVLKIDRWVTKAAPIVGVKYVREENLSDYLAKNDGLPS